MEGSERFEGRETEGEGDDESVRYRKGEGDNTLKVVQRQTDEVTARQTS